MNASFRMLLPIATTRSDAKVRDIDERFVDTYTLHQSTCSNDGLVERTTSGFVFRKVIWQDLEFRTELLSSPHPHAILDTVRTRWVVATCNFRATTLAVCNRCGFVFVFWAFLQADSGEETVEIHV